MFPAVKRSAGVSFFLFYSTIFPDETKQRASRQLRYYFTTMRSLWPEKSLSRLLQRFDEEDLSPRRMQPVVVKVDEWEECLGEGSAGFQDCSGKDCLKSKRFFSLRSRREGGRERGRETESFPLSFFRGGGGDEHKANNLSACLLGTWRRQHLCLAQPLSKSYFTFGWIYFSVKQKQKKRKKTLCKGSCQLQ